MDDEQFDGFVRRARMDLSSPLLYLDSTAAEGRARAYLEVYRPRGDSGDYLARLIAESESDKSSWDALAMIAQALIRKGEALPAALTGWAIDVLADQMAKRGEERRPRPSTGSDAYAGRDWNYYHYIRRLEERWNLKPTRNEASESCCGCEVVAAATGRPYKTVERIWLRRSREMRKA
ncbi:MAG: hypothetical protein OXF93_02140 [Acidobacteria bacterium]|nr:hypothetical protein [Acidobacteriota bacterium]